MSKTAMDEEWKNKVKGMLKAELARKGVKQTDLARMLEEEYGLKEQHRRYKTR